MLTTLGVGDKTYVFLRQACQLHHHHCFFSCSSGWKKDVSENTVSYFSELFGGLKILQDNSATVNEVDNLLDMRCLIFVGIKIL